MHLMFLDLKGKKSKNKIIITFFIKVFSNTLALSNLFQKLSEHSILSPSELVTLKTKYEVE